jgi:hypothetical protein
VAVLKYYNTATSAWEYIAASTTANFTTWKKTMAGGETSVSGTDDNGVTLSYTAGLEQVFINGALQARGSDYTATNGTSVTGLSALSVNDIVSVVCYAPFNVANTYTQAQTDSVAAAATGLRMVVPTSVSVGSGSGSVDAIGNVTFSGVSSLSLNGCFTDTYDNYKIILDISAVSGSNEFRIRGRDSITGDNSSATYHFQLIDIIGTGTAISKTSTTGATSSYFGYYDNPAIVTVDVYKPKLTTPTVWQIWSNLYYTVVSAGIQLTRGSFSGSTAFNSMSMISNAGTFSGTLRIYGSKD